MSGIGFSELIILFLIGLIVLGPERLPRVANQLGGWLGQARRMTRVMKRQLEEELDLEKELNIKPPPSVTRPDYVTPANETDDTYSPAHTTEDAGTGVGDEETLTDAETDTAEQPVESPLDAAAMEDDIDSTLAEAAPAEEDQEEPAKTS